MYIFFSVTLLQIMGYIKARDDNDNEIGNTKKHKGHNGEETVLGRY